jgi:radical SAM superfamily enzyme YgiQ (UPF0313 family)
MVLGPDWAATAKHPAHGFLSQSNVTSANGAFLATFLQRRGYAVHVIDNTRTQRDLLIEELDAGEDLLCVVVSTTHVRSFKDLSAIASLVKLHRPTVPIVAGGILVRHLPELLSSSLDPSKASLAAHRAAESRALALSCLQDVDFVISDQRGEASLLRLLHCLKTKSDISAVPNLSVRGKDGLFHYTTREVEPNEMALLEPILWNELPFATQEVVTTLTTRGCPFRCAFCVLHDSYPKVLYKPVEVLEREIRSLRHSPHIRGVVLADVEAFVSPKQIHSFLDLLIKHNPTGVQWILAARADAITDEVARKMREAGVTMVFAGFESGNQGQLDRMNKRLTVDVLRRATDLFHKYDIGFTTEWVVGFPGETDESIQQTIDLIEYTDSVYNLDMFRYHQGLSGIAKTQDKYGLTGLSDSPFHWRHDTMDSVGAAKAVCHIRDTVKKAQNEGSNAFMVAYLLMVAGLTRSETSDFLRHSNRLTDISMGRSNDDPAPTLADLDRLAARVLRPRRTSGV